MSILFKMARNVSCLPMANSRQMSTLLTRNTNASPITTATTATPLFSKQTENHLLNQLNPKRLMYTFRLSNKLVRNTHATRPRKTKNNSVELTYEQSQFAEKLGVTKSWNSWNTCKIIFSRTYYFWFPFEYWQHIMNTIISILFFLKIIGKISNFLLQFDFFDLINKMQFLQFN